MSFIVWDKESSLTMPSGVELSAEQIKEKYPFARSTSTKVILEKAGNITMGIDNLDILISVYHLDPYLTDDEMLKSIERAFLRGRNPQYDDIEEAIAILKGEIE